MRSSKFVLLVLAAAAGPLACNKDDSHLPYANATCTKQPCGVNGYHGTGTGTGAPDGGPSDAGDAGADAHD
jgi:hypothetical protein